MARKYTGPTRDELIRKVSGLGLKQLDAESVQLVQRSAQGRYVINKPIVYYSAELDTYVVFGDLREDSQQQLLNIANFLQAQKHAHHDAEHCDDPECE